MYIYIYIYTYVTYDFSSALHFEKGADGKKGKYCWGA